MKNSILQIFNKEKSCLGTGFVIDADQEGIDEGEFIELYDGGVGNVSLDGFVVVLYNGATDAVYDAIDRMRSDFGRNG